MEVQIESPPKIERDSWLGKIIALSGAKTWCSLVIRGIIALKLLALYGFGWYITFHLKEMASGNGFGDAMFFLFTVVIALATWVVTLIVIGNACYKLCDMVRTFNCWAQNKCTPIFKDEE